MPFTRHLPAPGAYRPMGPTSVRRRVARVAVRGTAATVRVGVRVGYRHRKPLAPVYMAVVLGAVAALLHTQHDGWKTAIVLAVVVGLALGGRQAHRTKRGHITRNQNIAAAAAYVGATAWLATATATVGAFTPPAPGFLLAWAFAAGVPWWLSHRERVEVPVEVLGESDPVEITPIYEISDTWQKYVAYDNGPLPESKLLGVELGDNGWSAEIELPRTGHLTTSSVLASTTVERIAKAYGLPTTSIVVEPPLTGDAGRARILVVHDNPLREVQVFEELTLDPATGYVMIGVHADGSPARWRLWTPGSGVNHGMIAGTTGAGKSGLLNTLLTEIRHSGLAMPLLGDPEDGESLPEWQDNVNCFGGTVPKIRRMLQCAERVMDGRKRRRRGHRWVDEQGREHRGKGFFEPSADDPAVYVIVEESPDVLADPECRRIIAKIGKKGRKWGVAVIIVTQIPSLSELGGDLSIRSMLSSTNIVMFRTSDKLSKQMGVPADLPIDPADLPAFWPDGSSTAGLGYVASAGGRVVPMRAKYVTDPYDWATTGEAAELDADGITDAGEYYVRWRELRDEEDDEDEDDVPAVSSSFGGTAAVAAAARTRRAQTSRSAILNLLRDSGLPMHTGVIADRIGVPKSTASTTLSRLADAGLVRQYEGQRGVWVAVEPAAENGAEDLEAVA